jgi:hypothetical protein
MPHRTFGRHCKLRLRPHLYKGLHKKGRRACVEKAVSSFERYREEQQTRRFYPLCTTIKKGTVPHIQNIAKATVYKTDVKFGHLILSGKAAKTLYQMPKSPPKNKAELNALVQDIARRTDLFPWEYDSSGCEHRARLAIDMLAASGIPLKNLGKQYASLPDNFNGHGWNFHVAVLVTLADGTSWIVDPTLDPKQALDLRSWITLQRHGMLPKQTMQVIDKSLIKIANGRPRLMVYDNSKCITFSTDSSSSMEKLSEALGTIKVSKLPIETEEDLRDLAIFRSKLEKTWLKVKR